MARSALIIGGGVIGATTAWYLAERGFDVTVLERHADVGLETSYANGGLLTPSQADPWNAPGTTLRLLRWLGREDSPLLLRPSALPGMAGWGLRFLLASRRPAYRRAAWASVRLGLYSLAALDELREQLDLQYEARLAGTLKVFRDRADLADSAALAQFLSAAGLDFETLDADAAAEREPALAPVRADLAGAIYYPADESGDAWQYTRAMTAAARRAGVRFELSTAAERLRANAGRIVGVETDRGEFRADAYVLAAGCGSRRLARQCGLRLPIYPAKGYSVTAPLADWSGAPRIPIVDFTRKVVINPLTDRLRIAGTAEFAGYNRELSTARADNVLRQALELLPEYAAHLERDKIERWTGLRPMTPDGPPMIGATPCRNLYLNTGHGPLGWTFAAGSGRLTADLVAGREPAIALDGLGYRGRG